MARIEKSGGYHSDGTSLAARSRRARLTAEFESDLGVDHAARRRSQEAEARWVRIKTWIVWTVALIFFTVACIELFVLRKEVQVPFAGLAEWFDWIDLPDPPPPPPPPIFQN